MSHCEKRVFKAMIGFGVLLTLFILLSSAAASFAAPLNPNKVITLRQPDGSSFYPENEGKPPDEKIKIDGSEEHMKNEAIFVTRVLEATGRKYGIDFSDYAKDGKITQNELAVYLILAGYEGDDGPQPIGPRPTIWEWVCSR